MLIVDGSENWILGLVSKDLVKTFSEELQAVTIFILQKVGGGGAKPPLASPPLHLCLTKIKTSKVFTPCRSNLYHTGLIFDLDFGLHIFGWLGV